MKKLSVLLLIIFLIFGVLLLWSNYEFIGLTKDTFGIDYSANTVFSFDSDRDFHGDGFAIDVERLNAQSQNFFKNPPPDFFQKYPLRHAHLGDFQIFKWRKTPVNSADTFRTNYGLKIDSTNDSYCLNYEAYLYLTKAEKTLTTPGNYYAMCFRDHPYKLYGIDLYIVSPTDGLIFRINRQ